jgi:leucine dehydrogenase
MWTYDDARSALRDVLRLSRAMTFKAAVAGLPLGGGKGVIMLHPGQALDQDRRREALLDFAETVASVDGRYLTAEDVGTSDADMAIIAQVTRHVTGLATGSGDPSPWTALGVESAMRVACGRVHLARGLAEAGAELVVADIDEGKRELAAALGAEWADPAAALRARVDVVAPCALGGILDDRSAEELRCRVIAGAANNQLASEGVADLLAAREILWAPDFVASAGGIVNIAVELEPCAPSARRWAGSSTTRRRSAPPPSRRPWNSPGGALPKPGSPPSCARPRRAGGLRPPACPDGRRG